MSGTGRRFTAVLVFLTVCLTGIAFTQLLHALFSNQQQLLLTEVASSNASAIERQLARSLSATDILAQEVIRNDGRIPDFDEFAKYTMSAIGGITNLQLAPDGVIRQIYPLRGSRGAIGYNILADDSQRSEANRAIDERQLTLAGPIDLVQGGIAVIGRNPVYLPRDSGNPRFWGFASALINLDSLLSVTDLAEFQERGYSYTLARVDPATGVRDIFARSQSSLTGSQQRIRVQVPNATWELTVSESSAGPDWQYLIGIAASIIAGLLAAWLVLYLMRQPERLRTAVRDKTVELREMAFNDHLTGLANRRMLAHRLDRRIDEAHAAGHSIAFLYLDLDGFKAVNDRFGHEVGDRLLQEIAVRLQNVVRDSDFVSRLGGDEFGVLLLDAPSEDVIANVAGKVIATVERPVVVDNNEIAVSASIGIARMPEDGTEAGVILSHADAAMYAAKRAGRGRYTFFHQSHTELLGGEDFEPGETPANGVRGSVD